MKFFIVFLLVAVAFCLLACDFVDRAGEFMADLFILFQKVAIEPAVVYPIVPGEPYIPPLR